MKDFNIIIKKEGLYNEHIKLFVDNSEKYTFEVLGSVGDKLLITDSHGNLLEVYPRFCKRVI